MTPEILASAGIELLALGAAAYMLYRQQVVIEKQAKALDACRHALDDERKAHAATHARLVKVQRVYKEECL